MRSADILNDYAFKFVFGADDVDANNALKGLLSVFLEKTVTRVIVKNSEFVKNNRKMKNSRLDLLVEFENGNQIDLEMQAQPSEDDLPSRFEYYMARLHGNQSLEGKLYADSKITYVLVFLNTKLYPQEEIYEHVFQYRDENQILMATQEDKQKIILIEMPKVNQKKEVAKMSDKEKVIYYFLNCQKGVEDVKIKEIIEQGGVVSMIEKRVENIHEDRWKQLNEEFEALAENERMMQQKLRYEKMVKQQEEKMAQLKEKMEAEQKKFEAEQKKFEAEQKKFEAEQMKFEAEQMRFETEKKKFKSELAVLKTKSTTLESEKEGLKVKNAQLEMQSKKEQEQLFQKTQELLEENKRLKEQLKNK